MLAAHWLQEHGSRLCLSHNGAHTYWEERENNGKEWHQAAAPQPQGILAQG